MAYNLNNYLNSRQQNKSSYSPFGGTPGKIGGRGLFSGMFNKSPKEQFINKTAFYPTPSGQKPQTPFYPTPTGQNTKPYTPSPSITSSNQSATAPITPKDQFVSQVASSSSYTPPASPIPPPTNTPAPEAPKSDPYLTYLQSLFDPEKTSTALTAKEDAMKRLSGIQSDIETKDLAARREYEAKLDESGGLREGAQASAQASARRSNQELADLAVQESAAARSAQVATDTYNEYINAGKTAYEAEQAAEKAKQDSMFTLSEGQVRYDAQGNIVAGGSSGFDVGSYTPGSDPTADSWVEYYRNGGDIGKVPEEYKSAALQGSQSQGKPISETAKNATGIVDELLQLPTNKITGLLRGFAWLPGTKGALTKSKYDQLKSLLQLDNIKLLKGTGAISDAEQRILEKASTSLNRKLSDKDFVKVLNDLKTSLSTIQTSEGNTISTPDGLQWRQLPDGSYEQVSFNSVGNTKASIPQSSRLAYVNNNPGNLRFAGQTGATRGEGGFAKFSSPQAGIQALQRQIQLDASRGLTLSQFISKYAPPSENDTAKYIRDVVAMTGASPNTKINSIDLQKLTSAIAQKESGTKIG